MSNQYTKEQLDTIATEIGTRIRASSEITLVPISDGARIVTESDLRGNRYLVMSADTPQTVTINTGMVNSQPFYVIQEGSGSISFNGTATLVAPDDLLSTSVQYSTVKVIPLGNNIYHLSGTQTAGSGVITPSATYTLSVPAATVTSDLIDFPLMIDLSEMPSSFWDNVSSDGGNVRVYDSVGENLIPHDLAYINTETKVGKLFAKLTITSATSTQLKVSTLASGSALSVSDTNGRNAVWSDYSFVWVFPDTSNRTGVSHAQDTSSAIISEWSKTDARSFTGANQGCATNGVDFITFGTNLIQKWPIDSSTLTLEVADVATSYAANLPNIDHVGDGVIVGTSIFVTMTSDSQTRRHLVEIALADLTFIQSWEILSPYEGFGATVCYDGTDLILCSYQDGSKFIRVSPTTGAVLSETSFSSPQVNTGIEGSVILPDGRLLISNSDDDSLTYVDPSDGTILSQNFLTEPNASNSEGLTYSPISDELYIQKASGVNYRYRRVPEFENWAWLQDSAATIDLPRSPVWTFGGSFRWTVNGTDTQQVILGMPSSWYMYDEGPDQLGNVGNSMGWLYATPGTRPNFGQHYRVAYQSNDNVQRGVYLDGAGVFENSPAVIPPSGVDPAQASINEAGGDAQYQFVWQRNEYMNQDWMAADAENNLNPGSFYSISEDP